MPAFVVSSLIVLVSVIFGLGIVAVKQLLHFMDPRALALLRALFALVVFLLWALPSWPSRPLPGRHWARLVLSGLLGIGLNQLLFVLGLDRTTASHSVVIVSAVPVMTLMLAIAAGQERFSGAKTAGFLLALSGIGYLMEIERLDWGRRAFVGDLFTVGNSLAYALFLVIARPLSRSYSVSWAMAMFYLVGSALLIPFGIGPLLEVRWSAFSATAWISLIFVLVFWSVGAHGLATWLLRYTDSSRVAEGVYLQPLIGVSAGHLWLGEPLSPRLFAATAVVLGGVFVSRLRRPSPTEGRVA